MRAGVPPSDWRAAPRGVTLALGEKIEAVSILVVIVFNAVIGFVTEWKAASALEGPRKQAVAVACVLRDGEERQIPAEDLVRGDVVLLLTGESLPVAKSDTPIDAHEALLGDRICMVHMGTEIIDGRGRFLVTATGARAKMGGIGTLIDEVRNARYAAHPQGQRHRRLRK